VLHGVARIVVDLDAAWGALAEWGASAANDTRTLEVSDAILLSIRVQGRGEPQLFPVTILNTCSYTYIYIYIYTYIYTYHSHISIYLFIYKYIYTYVDDRSTLGVAWGALAGWGASAANDTRTLQVHSGSHYE